MEYIFYSAFSFLAVSLMFVIQNILLLTTNSLVFVYEGIGVTAFFASLCLLYSSIKFLETKHNLKIKHLFIKIFSPAILYALAVLADFDFNALSLITSVVCFLLIFSSLLCIIWGFLARKAPAENTLSQSDSAQLFSKREQEVAALILQGKTTQETADALFISLATAKTHIQHIYEKTGVHNRAELALFVQNHPLG